MIVCIIAFAVSWATVGAMACNVGALVLLSIGISMGTLAPAFDEKRSSFSEGLFPDLFIVCLLWWSLKDSLN